MRAVAHISARRGFTLAELLVVVLIIGLMLATAALSVGAGTASAQMKNAVRSVWQLSGYARTMALLRQHPVVVTYTEVWEGNDFIKSQIEVKAGSEQTSSATEISTKAARSIYDPEAEVPALDLEGEEGESGSDAVTDEADEAAQEFANIHVKVELGEEGLSRYGKKKTVSVFSNVDFLLGKNKQDKQEPDAKSGAGGARSGESASDDEASRQEKREPVSIVFETNGRCTPHRILVWKDGQDERSARVLEVDRFGTIKNPDEEDDDR